MKLYSIDVSNYGNIIKQILLEEGLPFEMVKTPPNQEADYLAISPMGKIPAVDTANGVLSETGSGARPASSWLTVLTVTLCIRRIFSGRYLLVSLP